MRILILVAKRLAWFVPTAAGLIAIVFFLSRVIPADPVAMLAGETATPEQVEALRAKLGLDRPLIVQLADYYWQLLHSDLGISIFTNRPVAEDLFANLPATVELTVAAMIVAVLLGIPFGVISALKRNSLLDHALRIISVAGLAVASFWLALILQLIFAMDLGWLPLQGRIRKPYVDYQRAIGIPRPLIVWKYVLRNAITSTITQIGLLFGILLAGAVVIETVFQWPGIGAYAFEAILQSDYAGVMGFTVYAGGVFMLVNLIVDITHEIIDPRRSNT